MLLRAFFQARTCLSCFNIVVLGTLVCSRSISLAKVIRPTHFRMGTSLPSSGSVWRRARFPSSLDTPGALYCMVVPPGINTSESEDGPVMGEHFSWANVTRLCWVRNDGSLTDVNSITKVLTHELVEACTDADPFGRPAFLVTANDQLQEIGDVCNNQVQILNGFGVQPYWSNLDGACVAPRSRSVAWYLSVLGVAAKPAPLKVLASVRNTNSLLRLLSLPL